MNLRNNADQTWFHLDLIGINLIAIDSLFPGNCSWLFPSIP